MNCNSLKWVLEKAWAKLALSAGTRVDAEVLLCHVLKVPRSHFYLWPNQALTTAQLIHFQHLIDRRCQGEPIAYLTGFKEFWSLELQVTPATLIPRPDTELLVELALDHLSPNPDHSLQVLDLGTGSGAIALAIAKERPVYHLLATDNSKAALTVAQANAERLGIKNVDFLLSDWFSNLGEVQVDLIVSNPPYIASHDPHLIEEEIRYEPRPALVAEENGLREIRHLIEHAQNYLVEDSWLFLEHGYQQGEAVQKLFAQQGYKEVTTYLDLEGRERVTGGKRSQRYAGHIYVTPLE